MDYDRSNITLKNISNNMKDLLFLQILDLLGANGYFVRTEVEKEIFNNLLTQNLVWKKVGTKFCYILSSKGKRVLTLKNTLNSTNITFSEPEASSLYSHEEIRKLVKNNIHKLITPLRPMVRIPDLWNSLKQYKLSDLDRPLFEHILLDMHTNNEITLHEGFSVYETNNGIQYNKDQYYYYIMIES